jgi:glycosyltransferase involved in cell wall biosynthesis
VEFIPSPQKPGKFRVICVAQVALRKGHQYLLRAWKQLKFPDAELHCYGLIVPEVLEALNRINAPNVYFHGSVGKVELIRALQGSSAFVLASVEEGFAVSVLEGLACGLPVIATNATGAEGVITSGKNGLLAASGNVEELCVNLEKLYHDTDLQRHLGAGARELVETRYNWTSYVEELIRFYDVVWEEKNLE